MMIRKRDGRVVEFDETKITDAIFEAATFPLGLPKKVIRYNR